RSAATQRQTLRTEGLLSAALALHAGEPSAAVGSAYALLERRDPAEAARLSAPLHAFMGAPAQRRPLARLRAAIQAEIGRQGEVTRTTNPEARAALIVAVAAAFALVALLAWQFELQRRAGRIDRDYARRLQELVTLRDQFVASV